VTDAPRRPGPQRPRKPSFSERRERRAAVEDVAEVLEAGARFLEARSRSVAEVRRRLTTAGYRAELVEAAIQRLGDLGILDDEAFARAWVESRDRAHPRGEHALRQELRLKGVERGIVDAMLEERRAAADERAVAADDAGGASPDEEAAGRLLRRKLPAILREPDARRRRQRAYALLARGGFAPDVCGAVVRQVLADAAAEPGEVAEGSDGQSILGDEG
jgi:regulatory protein